MLASHPTFMGSGEPIPITVQQGDFEKLLSIFYPSYVRVQPDWRNVPLTICLIHSNPLESDLKDANDMSRAIRACQQLGFLEICKSVVQQAMKLSPVERIILSREHSIKELAISGYEELSASGKPVSAEDGEKLGAATVIKIWEVQQLLSAQDFCREGCLKEFLESTVKQKFGLE